MLFRTICLSLLLSYLVSAALPDTRPIAQKRTFSSVAINSLIDKLRPMFSDPDLGTLFNNCLPNTLDTTVSYFGKSSSSQDLDSFVITGDIDALWLRDSTNQVMPYIPYASTDDHLSDLIVGLINRQAKSVIIDPFANSFNFNASRNGHQSDRRTPPMTPSVFEGKYEIDSLCAFIKLSYWHWRYSGDKVLSTLSTETWNNAVVALLNTIETMQNDDGTTSTPAYKFQRETSEALDTLMMGGRGPPGHVCGLTRSLFRPSDDAVTLPYNIPGNAMACVELSHLVEILDATKSSNSNRAKSIRDVICSSLDKISSSLSNPSNVFPYEVDGGDGKYFMDDANIPSLLSLPVLGYMSAAHPVYQATRAYVQSPKNPFWFSGKDGEAVGGPHVGINYGWPMAITMRAMTSSDDEEIADCLKMLVKSSAGTGFMHESFNVNNVNDYTRTWFAWANGLFGELLLQVIKSKPHLVLTGSPAEILEAQALVSTPVSLLAQSEPIVKAK